MLAPHTHTNVRCLAPISATNVKGHLGQIGLRSQNESGTTLAEVIIALAISGIAISGGFLVNSHELRIVKSARETGAASGALEERVEQLRTASWHQITDSSYVASTYLGGQVKSVGAIPGYSERIVINAWPDPSAASPMVVQKSAGSPASVISPGTGLADQRLAKIDLRITWTGKDARTRVRELTTVVSNGGISRMNLPGMTGSSGGSDTSGSPTPTPAPGNNGNGNGYGSGGNPDNNGRGNVGGKPGQN